MSEIQSDQAKTWPTTQTSTNSGLQPFHTTNEQIEHPDINIASYSSDTGSLQKSLTGRADSRKNNTIARK